MTVLGTVRPSPIPSPIVDPTIYNSITVIKKLIADPNGKGARSTLRP